MTMEATPPPEVVFTENQIEAEGILIRFQEAGEGDRVVILDDGEQGISVLQETLARTYHVVVLGLETTVDSQPGAASRSASDLARTVGKVIARDVQGTYTLIGIALGANVALWHTLQDPNKVESLILVSPTAILLTDARANDTQEENGQPLFAHPQNASHDGEVQKRLNEIQCPTLVVFGSRDKMVSPEAARIYRENISNCNLSIVYDAGHEIGLDRPEALVDIVSDYVERRDTFVVNRQSTLINP